MAEFPALPFWTDAYLADTQHLTYEEHGIYFHILMTMWRTPHCQIPNDDHWIIRHFRCGGNANAVRTLCEEFCTLSEDGKFWYQKRLRKQWEWCCEKRQKAVSNAKYRWNKEKGISERIATAMPSESEGNASKSKSISTLKSANGFEGSKEAFKAAPGSPEFIAWRAYYSDKDNRGMIRELTQRELERRPFSFDSQWPPGVVYQNA